MLSSPITKARKVPVQASKASRMLFHYYGAAFCLAWTPKCRANGLGTYWWMFHSGLSGLLIPKLPFLRLSPTGWASSPARIWHLGAWVTQRICLAWGRVHFGCPQLWQSHGVSPSYHPPRLVWPVWTHEIPLLERVEGQSAPDTQSLVALYHALLIPHFLRPVKPHARLSLLLLTQSNQLWYGLATVVRWL